MAKYKVGGTEVVSDSGNVAWSLVSGAPLSSNIGSVGVSISNCATGGNIGGSVTANTTQRLVNVSTSGGGAPFNCGGNCNCDCDCACCFLGSEMVLMADGSEKRIEDIRPGDWVACHFQGSAPVLGLRRGTVSGNRMYRINKDLVTTGEHPFWVPLTREWVMADAPKNKGRVGSRSRLVGQGADFTPAIWQIPPIDTRQMRIGDRVLVGDNLVAITSIERIHLPKHIPVMTCITTSSMIVRGGWVVGGWTGTDYDKPLHDDLDRRLKMLRGEIPYHRWGDECRIV